MSASAPSPAVAAETLRECTLALESSRAAFQSGGNRALAISLYDSYRTLVSSDSWPAPYVYCYDMAGSALDSTYIAEPHTLPGETLGGSIGTGPGSDRAIASIEKMWENIYPLAQTQGGETFEYTSGGGMTQYLGQFMSNGTSDGTMPVLCSCRMNNFYERDSVNVLENIDKAALALLEGSSASSTATGGLALLAIVVAYMGF